jgi:hypothetical protein
MDFPTIRNGIFYMIISYKTIGFNYILSIYYYNFYPLISMGP